MVVSMLKWSVICLRAFKPNSRLFSGLSARVVIACASVFESPTGISTLNDENMNKEQESRNVTARAPAMSSDMEFARPVRRSNGQTGAKEDALDPAKRWTSERK